jgi:phosphoglycolate phosphatase-like HAD superfamily hydrolase
VKLILFDLDSTLLWSDGAGRRAIHRALVEVLGTAGPIDGFRFDGRTDGEIVSRLAEGAGLAPTDALVDAVLEHYVACLQDELAQPTQRTTVYPGVGALLDALDARADCVPGLLTGNVRAGAKLKLASGGLDIERFRVGAFGSDSAHRPDLPAVAQRRAREELGLDLRGHEIVVIGDTPADVTCGNGIGARAIGVATGAYSVADLMEAGADAAFEDLSDTEAVMASVFGEEGFRVQGSGALDDRG